MIERKGRNMEWNERLQRIIDYVENHLQRKQEPIDQREISVMAGCSFDFFQKVFSYMNGIGFSEYVRFRKLTLAGYDLKSTDKRWLISVISMGMIPLRLLQRRFSNFMG
ncbi:MAG: hypothetical protein ACLRMZ_06515 [Blautia marasmi]